MQKVIALQDVQEEDLPRVGGKALSLAQLSRNAFKIADALCITTEAYEHYVSATGLRERILLEINRKDFHDMRWEEMWDSALRIRTMFLKTQMPEELHRELIKGIETNLGDKAVVVRSSAPFEDSEKASFAGLHESYVNIKGIEAILEHIRLVWASLWSDAALLYRQELGLDVETSTMAVVIQEFISGERSGVAFSENPMNEFQAVIEAVHGLNQGLVDGTVEPDRWIFDRESGALVSHTPAKRDYFMVPGALRLRQISLPREAAQAPPLNEDEASKIFALSQQAEMFFGKPQDVEWTFREDMLYVLQSRPITTAPKPDPRRDRREWDLSLRRSYDNLRALRTKIEKEHIPHMIEEADTLARETLGDFSDVELAQEIQRRSGILQTWVDIYWSDFIPFAHGARLFGRVYNDAVRPEDPYEFLHLLQASDLQSLRRNRMLFDLASMVRDDSRLASKLRAGDFEDVESTFQEKIKAFQSEFGMFSQTLMQDSHGNHELGILVKLLLTMADNPSARVQSPAIPKEVLKERYLNAFKEGEQREQAREVLELGRVSYKLRDDDNIYLGRLEDQLNRAAQEGKSRLAERGLANIDDVAPVEVMKALQDPSYIPQKTRRKEKKALRSDFVFKGRQLVGQPAGPGVAKAVARVIVGTSDLMGFTPGHILVCDAIEPTMTFVVPLAAGIVERRGGMLIHGAIIAREYGLPCVTGVPNATKLIKTGDSVTVDGYLGIVTLNTEQSHRYAVEHKDS